MRIASYNIRRSIGRSGREDPELIARVLRELDAHVVALQEVGYRTSSSVDVLRYLAGAMRAKAVEGVTLHDERGSYGNAVLSRLPILNVDRLDISVPRREPRGAIELTLEVETSEVQLVATHLGLRAGERRLQIERLLSRIETSSADVQILLGDLNEWFLWGRPLRWLQAVFGKMPAPATFPAHRPWFALDRLWVRPEDVVERLEAHDSPNARVASDHLPIVADLRIHPSDSVRTA